ncbi:5-deoxy-glucuronate isomerase [Pseudomaricurvus alkylphenolicus]|jgi:5-deoxy-glucuronate isomerase|uniref:5-deoxy-glucuronate isomerase n=1 Tax=Pseudomaricurvus alkylphenolicus TaxID=1306991 RepID=UPI00141F37B5|nr:5-deoxy-glucuronate isomerase [Pseudomaricurvus alkylphenolicus]NIB40598.1 5-deoxy-glucuronate isomerase [Pseudomaricurvus alkylphenolicus]
MSEIIYNADNHNEPVVDAARDDSCLKRTYFNRVRLTQGQQYRACLQDYETVYVLMSGKVDIVINDETFVAVGGREDVWSGTADSVYAPVGASVSLRCVSESCEVAVAGGLCTEVYQPFRITPSEVDMVDVGSQGTHSRRCIFHILGQNAAGRAGNLLVSELYADEGCWSGYPPHKHDEDREGESHHEEVYHYRFEPNTGFGGQFVYDDDSKGTVYKTGDGDTVLIEGGYHPTVTSPGHKEYIFTILVGRQQRSLLQHFHERNDYLMDSIPGLGAMRDKFK